MINDTDKRRFKVYRTFGYCEECKTVHITKYGDKEKCPLCNSELVVIDGYQSLLGFIQADNTMNVMHSHKTFKDLLNRPMFGWRADGHHAYNNRVKIYSISVDAFSDDILKGTHTFYYSVDLNDLSVDDTLEHGMTLFSERMKAIQESLTESYGSLVVIRFLDFKYDVSLSKHEDNACFKGQYIGGIIKPNENGK